MNELKWRFDTKIVSKTRVFNLAQEFSISASILTAIKNFNGLNILASNLAQLVYSRFANVYTVGIAMTWIDNKISSLLQISIYVQH